MASGEDYSGHNNNLWQVKKGLVTLLTKLLNNGTVAKRSKTITISRINIKIHEYKILKTTQRKKNN